MERKVKALIIFFCGGITLILKEIMPIAGGGASLIFVLSIPVLIILGLTFSLVYYVKINKLKSKFQKHGVFSLMLIILLGLAFLLYPYAL